MIKVLLGSLLVFCTSALAEPMNLQAQLAKVLVKKILNEPNIGFKDLIQFANELEPVSVLVSFDLKQFSSEKYERTACGTLEAEIPVVSFDGKTLKVKSPEGVYAFSADSAKPTMIEWNSRKYLVTGPRPPYGLDSKNHRLKFIFSFPEGVKVPINLKWWREIVARVPELGEEQGPYLIVESTSKGLHFSTNFEDYRRTPFKEVPGTHEEYVRNPFSKIFAYASENSRIQMPQSCK